jgi:hypothetical protein
MVSRLTGWITILVLLLAVPSWGQSVYGQGGLFLHPSAYVRPAGSVNFGVSYFTQTTQGGQSEWNPYALSYGFSDRFEAGVTAVRHQGESVESHAHVGPFFRYEALSDTPSRPAFGMTVSNLPSDLRELTVAGVFSHRFNQQKWDSLAVHVGAEWVRTGGETGNQTDFAGFVGIQLPVVRNIVLVGDIGTKLKFEPSNASAIGLMYSGPRGGSLAIGWVNNGRGHSNEFFIGAGYPIGGAK